MTVSSETQPVGPHIRENYEGSGSLFVYDRKMNAGELSRFYKPSSERGNGLKTIAD